MSEVAFSFNIRYKSGSCAPDSTEVSMDARTACISRARSSPIFRMSPSPPLFWIIMTSLMVVKSGCRLSGMYARGLKSPSRHEIGHSGECECLSSWSVIGMSSLLVILRSSPSAFREVTPIDPYSRQVPTAHLVVDRLMPCAGAAIPVGEMAAKSIHKLGKIRFRHSQGPDMAARGHKSEPHVPTATGQAGRFADPQQALQQFQSGGRRGRDGVDLPSFQDDLRTPQHLGKFRQRHRAGTSRPVLQPPDSAQGETGRMGEFGFRPTSLTAYPPKGLRGMTQRQPGQTILTVQAIRAGL